MATGKDDIVGELSFWQAGKELVPLVDSLILNPDIVIVGAGIVGLSTAFHLLEIDQNLKIQILEANLPGYGGTGRSGGVLVADDEYVANSEMDVEYLRRILREKLGINLIEQANPRSDKLAVEYYNDLIDPMALIAGLTQHVSARGGSIHCNTSVNLCATSSDNTGKIICPSGSLSAGACLFATGAYSDGDFLSNLGLVSYTERVGVVDIVAGRPPWTFFSEVDETDYIWGRAIGADRLLIGGGEKFSSCSTSKIKTANKLYDALKFAELNLEYGPMKSVWSGRLSKQRNGKGPVLVDMNAKIPSFFAGGFDGYGLAAGFNMGKRCAELLLSR